MISDELNDIVLKKLENGPIVLLVGQSYLKNGQEVLINKLKDKFPINDLTESLSEYDLVVKIIERHGYENVVTWLLEFCKIISIPTEFERIGGLPWSSVFTTAFDSILSRAFWSEWRKVQPVFDERFNVFESRNKFLLHINYLFGCITQTDYSQRPPVSLLDKAKRKAIANTFLSRLPGTVTPMGLLVIEGYKINDWLRPEDLYGVTVNFGQSQILLFNATEEHRSDPFLAELFNTGKLIFYTESFAQYISEAELLGKIKFPIPDQEDYYGKWVTINGQKIQIPQDKLSRISRVATIVEEGIFEVPEIRNAEEKYLRFRHFLSSTSSFPEWGGYVYGFAFQRDCFSELSNLVTEKIKNNIGREQPIVLTGQSSSGKTVALGNLAYTLFKEGTVPVLFIEKRFQKVDHFIVDDFGLWAEESGAICTVIIWDGLMDATYYQSFLNRLLTRGRKVVLIGSSYESDESGQYCVRNPVDLDKNEKKRFVSFLQTIDPDLGNIVSGFQESNLLSMLYRHLPGTRAKINQGLKAEFDFFAKLMRDSEEDSEEEKKSIFRIILESGAFNDDEDILDENISLNGEQTNLADMIIYLVMIPGQFGLGVPFELILRIIGYENISSAIFKMIEKVKLIRWSEDSQGNILITPRTALEAKILVNYLGDSDAQAEYIISLLSKIQSFDYHLYDSSPEIHFAVELLNYINPNVESAKVKFSKHWYRITKVLRNLRESNVAYHPRLILKEASFLRELTKVEKIELEEPKLQLLARGETILRSILEELSDYEERTITTFLRIELATNLGYQAMALNEEGYSLESVIAAYEGVKSINTRAFAVNPDNYYALDVLVWTTEYLIRENIFSDVEKIEAQVETLNLFDLAEMEGVLPAHSQQFNLRKLKFNELIGNQNIAQSIFDDMVKSGQTAGFYFTARKILGNAKTTDSKIIDFEVYNKVFEYLKEHYDLIRLDGRCVFLLMKSWWIVKTKSVWFQEERQVVPLSQDEWTYFYFLINALLLDSDVYFSSSILYFKALAEFHLGLIKDCLRTFEELSAETDFSSIGKKRVIRSYLASDESGKAKVFTGYVNHNISHLAKRKFGDLHVNELNITIGFSPYDFGKTSFQKDEVVESFNIAFNFRGPIADVRRKAQQ